MIENKYGVPKRVWNRWTRDAKQHFADTFEVLESQALLSANRITTIPDEHWDLMRWNAAFLASEILSSRQKGDE